MMAVNREDPAGEKRHFEPPDLCPLLAGGKPAGERPLSAHRKNASEWWQSEASNRLLLYIGPAPAR